MPFEMNMQKSRATARINKYKIRGERTQKTKTGSILELRPRQLDKPSSQRDSGCGYMGMEEGQEEGQGASPSQAPFALI